MLKSKLRKGISPLIASVLLMAFTLSVAVLFSPWATNILDNIQSDTSDGADRVITASNMDLKLVSADFNHSTQNLSITVQNKGGENFSNFSITVMSDKPYNRQFSRSLSSQEIATVEMYAGDPFDMNSVSASLTNYPVSTERGIDGVPAENHLVSYWSLDSGSGVYANDSISSNDGELRNGSITCSGGLCPNWNKSGVFGNQIDLDGENDFIKVSNPVSLPVNNGPFVYSFYITPREGMFGGDRNGWVLWRGGNSNDNLLSIGARNGKWELAYWSNDWKTDVDLEINETQHIAVVYRPDIESGKPDNFIYKNGVKKDSKEVGPLDLKNSSLYIGARKDRSKPADAWIDEVKIWNTPISGERIRNPVELE